MRFFDFVIVFLYVEDDVVSVSSVDCREIFVFSCQKKKKQKKFPNQLCIIHRNFTTTKKKKKYQIVFRFMMSRLSGDDK